MSKQNKISSLGKFTVLLGGLCIALGILLYQQIKSSQRASMEAIQYKNRYDDLKSDLEKVKQRSIFVQDSLDNIINDQVEEIDKYIDSVKKEQEKYRTVIHRLRTYDADSSSIFISGRIH